MDRNQNQRDTNADGGSNESKEQDSQDKFLETQHATKLSGSSHKNQSRPNSRASIGHHSRTRSNSQTNKSWDSINPFINFMSDFRKTQAGERSANIFRLGGEQWRNMTIDEKQPFVDAANQNKKLKQPRSNRKQQQKQNSLDKQKSKTSNSKDTAPNKSNSSQKVLSPKKKRKRSQQRREETELKKKRTTSDTETDTDTDTSGSIHTATTDCASEDSDESS